MEKNLYIIAGCNGVIMGHIREPKGVDFFIKSEPLTKQVREEISEFIREYKNKSAAKTIQKKAQI